MIEVYVSGLAFDTMTSSPVVLLRERRGERVLPIWIGVNEASVIAMELSGASYKRPLTHDLLKAVLAGFNADMQKIVVSSLKDNTFFAKLYIVAPGNSLIEIDARPSDSIAMALKMKSPIFISSDLDDSFIEISSESTEESAGDDSLDTFDLGDRLRNIRPEDFGNFNL